MFSWSESIQILFFQWHDSDLCQLWIKPHMEEMHCISCFLALDLHVIIYQRSARTRASKSGWVAAWWRMPATYIASPSCASHTISAALCHAHKSSMWCAVRLQRGTGVCSHRSTGLGKAVADKQETLIPSSGLLSPHQPRSAKQSSWKPAVLSKRTEEFLVGSATALFIYFPYLPHSSH